MDTIDEIVHECTRRLAAQMKLNLMATPSSVCTCGKPIVFPKGRKTHTCTRCGKKYRLEIKIVPIFRR